MKVSKNTCSLSDSSSGSDFSESEDRSPLSANKNSSIEMPQIKNRVNSEGLATASSNVIPENNAQVLQGTQIKKRPPSPETMSKILGFEVREAPRFRISKKKDSGSIEPLVKRPCLDKLQRADDLEHRYPWLLSQEDYEEPNVASRFQNPYDIDDMDDCPSSVISKKPKAIADKVKIIGEQWGSMVAPFSEEVNEDSPASRWPEYHSLKVYSDKDKSNGHRQSSSYKHKRSSHDQKSRHRRHDRDESRSVYIQTDQEDFMVSVGTQTASRLVSVQPKALAASEFYHNQLQDLKEVYSSMPEGIDKVLSQIRICVLETLEAVALSKEKTDPSTLSRKFTEVVQRCRRNLDAIKIVFRDEGMSFVRDAFLVITMKLMSFLYHNLYLTRRAEVSGAKGILDEFLTKKLTPEQHVPQRVTNAMQFYATYMEHLAKSFNYSERADIIIDNCKSDFFHDFNFKDVKSDCAIQSLVSLINSAILELNSIIEDMG